jgi:hypothetical protein
MQTQTIPETPAIESDGLPREIQIITPHAIQGDHGEILSPGERYRVRYELASMLVRVGQALDVATGERYDKPKGTGKFPPQQGRSGDKARIRIRPGFAIQGDDGEILEAGEHLVPIELLNVQDGRYERLDVDQVPRRTPEFGGEPHLVRIGVSGGLPFVGAGVWCASLDRHVDFGEEITIPDEEAQQIIRACGGVSLRAEMPNPAVEAFADFIADGNEEKKAMAAKLAQGLVNSR